MKSQKKLERVMTGLRVTLICVPVLLGALVAVDGKPAVEPPMNTLLQEQADAQRREAMAAALAEYDAQEAELEDGLQYEQETILPQAADPWAAVPLPEDLRETMREACATWDVPYALALAVAEVESGFSVDAISPGGDVGLMQLNPGPNGAYHAALQAATGLNPNTPAGNIAGGCYLLGENLDKYEGDTERALLAYNAGAGGAAALRKKGITSTAYTEKVMSVMEKWEEII